MLNGQVDDWGWVDFDRIAQLAVDARIQVAAIEGTGFSVPFRSGGRLNMIWVEERREPEPLDLAEVAERVEKDFIERSRQRLYQEIAAELLETLEFRFDEAALARALSPNTSPQ